jgi:glutamate racemase
MLTVFDSGVGGLTVLREVRKVYKGPILYLGDTLRAPYGNRNEEELIRYMKELISAIVSPHR